MKTINHFLSKILLGTVLGVFLLNVYSCSQESVVDSEETPTAVNAVTKYGKDKEEDKVKRPWKIKSSGTFQAIGPSELCTNPDLPVTILLDGSGTASHIGTYSVAITWCTNEGFDLAAPENFIDGTLTVANGDLIYFESTSFNGPSVDYIVTGGTGRFDGATGEFNLATTQFDPQGGTYANEGEGYIVY